jgi:hypothetical protein
MKSERKLTLKESVQVAFVWSAILAVLSIASVYIAIGDLWLFVITKNVTVGLTGIFLIFLLGCFSVTLMSYTEKEVREK